LKKTINQKGTDKKDSEPLLTGKREGVRLSLRKYINRLTKKESQKKDEEDKDNKRNNDINSKKSFEDGDIYPNKRLGEGGGGGQRNSNNFSFSKNKSIFSPSNTTNKQSNYYNESYNQVGSRFTFIKNKAKNNVLIIEDDSSSYDSEIEGKEDDSSYSNKSSNDSYNKSSKICDNDDSNKSTKKKSLDKNESRNTFKIIINKPEKENDSIIKSESINDELNLVINNEIYSDELFGPEYFNDEKPKEEKETKERNIIKSININHSPIVKDGVYINNLNIIETKYLDSSSEKNKDLQEKIKKLELELKQKNKFDILEISSTESTIEIDSCYENINEISNNKYLYDKDLRDMTKKFIIRKSKISNKQVNSISGKNKRRSSFDYENDYNNMKKKILAIRDKSSKNVKGVLSKMSIKIKNMNNLRDKFLKTVHYNSNNKADNFIKKVKKLQPYESNIKHSRRLLVSLVPSNTEIFLSDRIKSNNLEDEKDFNSKKYEVFSKKNPDYNSTKKRKRNTELDLIQFNIRKSSQNLNQPDAFYAGLFSQLIIKSSYENSHINNNDNNNNISNNSKPMPKDDSSFNSDDDES